MGVCTNCKYYATCGDDNRTEKCSGYEFERPADLPTYEQEENRIRKNKEKIEKLTEEINALNYIDERNACRDNRDFATLKNLREKAHNNSEAITKKCNEIERLKIENQIMRDNLHYIISVEAVQAILEASKPYEGKSYGEKTAQKIYDEVKKSGYGFWFKRSPLDNTGDYLVVYRLIDGYRVSYTDDVTLYPNDYNKPFITKDNKLNLQENRPRIYTEYTKDVTKKAKEIIKAFRAYKDIVEKADKMQNAFNHLLPNGIDSFRNVSYCRNTLV